MPILKKKEPVKVKSTDTVIRITNPNGKPKEVDGEPVLWYATVPVEKQ